MKTKGQGVIAEILIFGTVMILSVTMLFLVTMGDDNPVKEENIEASLERESSGVEDEALLTYVLHQEIDMDIAAGQIHDASIFYNIVEPDSDGETICEHSFSCDEEEDNLGAHLPAEFQLHVAAENLEDEVKSYHEDDPRRIQYNQFANSSHPLYEPDIRYYGEHSDYHESRKGGCNFNIDDSSDYKEKDYEDSEVCTDFLVHSSQSYNMTFYEVIQEYFTGDEFRTEGTTYDKSGVKRDLKQFLEQDYSDTGDSNLGHLLAQDNHKGILNINSGEEQIEAESQNDIDVRYWKDYNRKVPTSNGNVDILLWVGRP